MATDFNGWTNRPTWAANLWLSNHEPAYRAACEALSSAPGADAHRAGVRLRTVWRTIVPAAGKAEASPSLDINWDELGEAWLDDLSIGK